MVLGDEELVVDVGPLRWVNPNEPVPAFVFEESLEEDVLVLRGDFTQTVDELFLYLGEIGVCLMKGGVQRGLFRGGGREERRAGVGRELVSGDRTGGLVFEVLGRGEGLEPIFDFVEGIALPLEAAHADERESVSDEIGLDHVVEGGVTGERGREVDLHDPRTEVSVD